MDDLTFQTSVVDRVEGWLNRVTSLRTMDILSYQEAHNLSGPIVEIGVFCGKYFSVLARSAQRMRDRILGIDTFQYSPESRVREALAMSADTSKADVALWKKFSHECSAEEIVAHCKGRPRFISVDGSHECEDVFLDLELSERLISTKGIIAADDFLNPMTIGVNEAIHKFFARPRLIVPVAYVSNKLFLAHRAVADEYRTAIEKAIVADTTEPECRNFRESLAKARHFVEQRLWGHPIVLC